MSVSKNSIRSIKKILDFKKEYDLRWFSVAATIDKPNILLSKAKPFEEIPSLKIFPLLGTAWAYLPIIGRDRLDKMHIASRERRQLFGDIYREKFGPMDLVFVFKPDDIQTIFQNEGKYPVRTETQALKAYRNSRKEWYKSPGVIILEGKEWWDLRSKVQKHLMKPKAVLKYLFPMQDVARDMIQKMKHDLDSNKEVPGFLNQLHKWSLESIALVCLDTRLGCLKDSLSPDSDAAKMIESSLTKFECLYLMEPISGNLPWWKFFPTPIWNKFVKASDVFSEIAFKHINNAIDDLKKNATDEDKELTLLQSMLMEKGLDVSGVLVTVADMLFGGIDTTSRTADFLLYALAKNPDKQELLYQEIKKLLPTKEHRITSEILNEMRYLKACLKETQRILPLFIGAGRTLNQDAVLSGYRVPAGTLVIANLYETNQDEKYFKDAMCFLPERWLARDKTVHPFAFLPFGFGIRSCLGRRLAELEVYCLLTEIIRNFKVEYHYEDIELYNRLTFIPDKPLRFTFIEK